MALIAAAIVAAPRALSEYAMAFDDPVNAWVFSSTNWLLRRFGLYTSLMVPLPLIVAARPREPRSRASAFAAAANAAVETADLTVFLWYLIVN